MSLVLMFTLVRIGLLAVAGIGIIWCGRESWLQRAFLSSDVMDESAVVGGFLWFMAWIEVVGLAFSTVTVLAVLWSFDRWPIPGF